MSFGFSFLVVVEIGSLPDRYIVLFHIGIVLHFWVQQKTVGFTSLNLNRLPGISTLSCSFFCHQCIYEWCLNLLVHNMHWWHCRYAGRADAGSGAYAGAHLVRTLSIVVPALRCQHVVVPATSAIFLPFCEGWGGTFLGVDCSFYKTSKNVELFQNGKTWQNWEILLWVWVWVYLLTFKVRWKFNTRWTKYPRVYSPHSF